jgi:ribonuclease P protein component
LDQRLRPTQRIRRRSDFTRIQEHGARVGSAHFTFLVALHEAALDQETAAQDATSTTRLGIVASRKVGNAVRRNRIKRLLREAFRKRAAELPRGIDLVVIARAGAHELAAAQVDAELLRALPRIADRARTLALAR